MVVNPFINDEPEVEETIIAGIALPPDVVGNNAGKTLDDCKLRFGSGDLPFGSFPSDGSEQLMQDWQQAALQHAKEDAPREPMVACWLSSKAVSGTGLQEHLNRGRFY